ncbi:MAG: MBL fold metallo-hydrolase [Lachnospiraceae bacterium]|nr:MBL fold metallo-hydrolase [Lachnospiraceae bacterium]
MYELIQAVGDSYYIQCPAKIGLVRLNQQDVCLIDSGNDKNAGRKVRQILDAQGWHLRAIYNTHSHADHIGGNQYLQKQTGCKVYASGIECSFTRHPVLEPVALYGGCPPTELRHKFLMAQESEAEDLTRDVLPDGLEVLPLPGHCFDMVGFRTADGVIYLADCLSSAETLEKYQIGYIYDVGAYLDTLEKVKSLQAKLFIPAHTEPTEDIVPLAELNIAKVEEIAERIAGFCETPCSFEEILQNVFDGYGLVMNFEQHALVGSTVRSYLSWLKGCGRVDVEFENNRLLWKRTDGGKRL